MMNTALYHTLQETAARNGGGMSFAEFMHLALYAPGLGYYSAGLPKLGPQGDFITAPEISPLFSQCLALQCQQILSPLVDGCILELGAGSGKMAAEIIRTLSKHDALPKYYYILEVSADLRQRQQVYLQAECPDFFANILWLDRLPEKPFNGIILGNEVIDAMPVHLFQINDNHEVSEGYVSKIANTWQCTFRTPFTPGLKEAVHQLQQRLPEPLSAGYTSEINLRLEPWLASLRDCLAQGVMIFLDYGFPSHEYYHPSRSMGTLMCHFRHRAHPQPFENIGLQDITAHVDFTALALAAQNCQLTIAGFTHQCAFLLSNGLLSLAENMPQSYLLSQQVQQLIQTHEMGELCKVMALSSNFDEPLQGFTLLDHRYRL